MRDPLRPRAAVTRGDVALAALLTAVALGALLLSPATGGFVQPPGPPLVSIAACLLMTLPAVWRRRYPMPVVAVAGPVALVSSLGAPGVTIGAFVTWWLLGSAALHTDRPTTVLLAVTGVLSVGTTVYTINDGTRDLLAMLTAAGVGALPALVGDALRRQRELTAEVLRLRAAELEAATKAERVRIARDLHDTVGHHLGAIGLRARAAELDARDGDLEEAAEALAAIGRLGDRALEDTRVLLGVLRDDDEPGLRPTPVLRDLPELVETARLAGVAVTVDGAAGDLSDAVGTAGYRIVQEALTNVARHAAPAGATVRIRRSDGRLRLTVTDDGGAATAGPGVLAGGSGAAVPGGSSSGAARPDAVIARAARGGADPTGRTNRAAGAGRGLVGMRERALAVGGTVDAGPLADGGWRVHADLPDAT